MKIQIDLEHVKRCLCLTEEEKIPTLSPSPMAHLVGA